MTNQRTYLLQRMQLLKRQAEATEATISASNGIVVAAVRNRVLEAKAEIRDCENRLAALDDDDESKRQIAVRESQILAHDNAQFWFRRFFTSLALVHGAAFAATIGGLLQAQHPEQIAPMALWPLIGFGIGVVMAGLIPFALYIQTAADNGIIPVKASTANRIAVTASAFVYGLTLASTVLFVAALCIIVAGVSDLAERGRALPTQYQAEAPPKKSTMPSASAIVHSSPASVRR